MSASWFGFEISVGREDALLGEERTGGGAIIRRTMGSLPKERTVSSSISLVTVCKGGGTTAEMGGVEEGGEGEGLSGITKRSWTSLGTGAVDMAEAYILLATELDGEIGLIGSPTID